MGPKASVSRAPISGGVVLEKAPPMRNFSILIVGSTDGMRLRLAPPQLAGISPLEATGILSQLRIGAPAGPMPGASQEPKGGEAS